MLDETHDLADFVTEAAMRTEVGVDIAESSKAGMEDDVPGDTTTTATLALGDAVDAV